MRKLEEVEERLRQEEKTKETLLLAKKSGLAGGVLVVPDLGSDGRIVMSVSSRSSWVLINGMGRPA